MFLRKEKQIEYLQCAKFTVNTGTKSVKIDCKFFFFIQAGVNCSRCRPRPLSRARGKFFSKSTEVAALLAGLQVG